MEWQYYFDEDFTGAEYRAVIDLVGRKANFVGLVFSVGIGREERLAFEGKVSELGGIVIESSEWSGTVYYGGDRKIAVFRLNERVFNPFLRAYPTRGCVGYGKSQSCSPKQALVLV